MNTLVITIITTLSAGLTSGGFLGFILKIVQRKDTSSQMLLGLGHHEILEVGQSYINRGWVTIQELDDFNHYLYVPYRKLGGNGTGALMANRVNSLPIRNTDNIDITKEKEN